MTRKSKIARLPRSIRDELNRRLDNGQPGVRLVEWLNGLPEAKEVLAGDFAGRCITPQNISEWKRGGYQDWLTQQERRADLQDFLADAKELGEAASPEKLTEAIFNVVLVHYAAAMYRCIGSPEHRNNLNLWSQMLNDVIRLRNSDLAQQRFDLDTQKLEIHNELARQRLELDRARLERARQKAPATTVGHASRPCPTSFPIPATREQINAYHTHSSSAVASNTEHATRNTEKPTSTLSGRSPIPPSNNSGEINSLQPNPNKSNNPFFIFPQSTTVGQTSCLSSFLFLRPPDKHHPTPQRLPERCPRITEHATRNTTTALALQRFNASPSPQSPAFPPKIGVISVFETRPRARSSTTEVRLRD